LGGVVFASRPILDSFGLVRIEGVAGVDVYQNGSLAGQTDGDGALVLTRLNPYMENRIAIDDKRVPIDIALNAREQRVAPAYRSGVIVDFGARRLPNALVEVRLPGGEPLPPGAEVRRLGGGAIYLVGFDGEVFIPDLSFGATYVAQWPGERCEFAVPAAAAPLAAMPRLGPITCAARRERS
jgi:outer membrane usher protein